MERRALAVLAEKTHAQYYELKEADKDTTQDGRIWADDLSGGGILSPEQKAELFEYIKDLMKEDKAAAEALED